MEIEEWRDVPGYEGKYQVSNLGRVRSLDRFILGLSKRGLRYPIPKKGKILTPGLASNGYLSVSLCGRTFLIHQIVALAFIGPRPKKHEVLHKDGDRMHCHRDNLRYGTRFDNVQDAKRHGTQYVPPFKLSPDQKENIKTLYNTGKYTQYELASMFGVHFNTIYNIRRGRSK